MYAFFRLMGIPDEEACPFGLYFERDVNGKSLCLPLNNFCDPFVTLICQFMLRKNSVIRYFT